ncbi:unnamed protein product [Fusarium langsethiae]|nr:unnamed protein product [Fusarium langsethiae]
MPEKVMVEADGLPVFLREQTFIVEAPWQWPLPTSLPLRLRCLVAYVRNNGVDVWAHLQRTAHHVELGEPTSIVADDDIK